MLLVRIQILIADLSSETNTRKKNNLLCNFNNCLDLLLLAEFHGLLVLILQDQQISPMVEAILPHCFLERTCMLWAALKGSVYWMKGEIILYKTLGSKYWTMGTCSERKKVFVIAVSLQYSLDCHWKQIMLVAKCEQSKGRGSPGTYKEDKTTIPRLTTEIIFQEFYWPYHNLFKGKPKCFQPKR